MLNSDRQDKRRTNPRIAWRRPAGLSVASGCLLGTVAAGLFLLATAWPNPRGASLVLVGAVGLSLLLYIFWRSAAPSARNPRQNKMQPESLNIKGHQRSAISDQLSSSSSPPSSRPPRSSESTKSLKTESRSSLSASSPSSSSSGTTEASSITFSAT